MVGHTTDGAGCCLQSKQIYAMQSHCSQSFIELVVLDFLLAERIAFQPSREPETAQERCIGPKVHGQCHHVAVIDQAKKEECGPEAHVGA
jgi:hypothetical protein